jgi:hypothetical protein
MVGMKTTANKFGRMADGSLVVLIQGQARVGREYMIARKQGDVRVVVTTVMRTNGMQSVCRFQVADDRAMSPEWA